MFHKSEVDKFFGYKTHLVVTGKRIIIGLKVTNGIIAEGKQLSELIEKSQRAGLEAEDVIGDTAYSGKENLEYAFGE